MRKIFFISVYLFAFVMVKAQDNSLVVPVGHNNAIFDFTISPDGRYMASGDASGMIKLWDVKTMKELATLTGHRDAVFSLCFSPDGKYLASGDHSGVVNIWSIKSKNIIRQARMHSKAVQSISFSRDDKMIATTSADTTVVIYSIAADSVLQWYTLDGAGLKLQFTPDGKHVAVLDQNKPGESSGVYFIDLQKMNFDSSMSYSYVHGDIEDFEISPDGRYTYNIVNTDSGGIRVHLIGGKDVWRFNGDTNLPVHICTTDSANIFYTVNALRSNRIDSAGINHRDSVTREFKRWDISSRRCTDSVLIKTQNTNNTKFQYDAQTRKLYFTSGWMNFTAVNSNSPYEINHIIRNSFALLDAWFISDSSLLLTNVDGYVNELNIHSRIVQSNINRVTTGVFSSGLSPDSSSLIVCPRDKKTVLRYNLLTKKLTPIYTWHHPIGRAIFSHDHKRICLVYDSINYYRNPIRIAVYDIISNKVLLDSVFLFGQVWEPNVSFSPNGKKLILSHHLGDSLYVIDIPSHHIRFLRYSDKPGTVISVFTLNDSLLVASYSNIKGFTLWNYLTGKISAKRDAKDEFGLFVPMQNGTDFLAATVTGDIYQFDLKNPGWKLKIPGKASIDIMGVSKNDSVIYSYGQDNVFHFYNSKTGSELFDYVGLDSAEYLISTTKGYYRSTPQAAKLLYFVTPDDKIIGFDQLDVKYNRPDIVLANAGSRDTTVINAYYRAYQKRIRKLGIDTASFSNGTGVPVADIINADSLGFSQAHAVLNIHFNAKDSVYFLDRFNVLINEVPLFGMKGLSLRQRKLHLIDSVINIPLSQGKNIIEVSVTNVNGTESYHHPVTVSYANGTAKEKLHFIGIGIDRFSDGTHNLNYSVEDVRNLCTKLKEKYREEMTIDTLFNESLTIENVKSLKKKLLKTGVNDKVILSYSGHGLLSKDFDYYLSTYAVDFNSPEKGGLPYDVLESLLDSIPARKKLMLIDACHSGEVDKEEMEHYRLVAGTNKNPGLKGGELENTDSTAKLGMKNSFELMQELFVNVGRSTGATIISAASGTQLAQERGDLKNGVFTYSILEYMEKHPTATVTELKNYVNKRVPELTNGLQVPTTRTETRDIDWKVW